MLQFKTYCYSCRTQQEFIPHPLVVPANHPFPDFSLKCRNCYYTILRCCVGGCRDWIYDDFYNGSNCDISDLYSDWNVVNDEPICQLHHEVYYPEEGDSDICPDSFYEKYDPTDSEETIEEDDDSEGLCLCGTQHPNFTINNN